MQDLHIAKFSFVQRPMRWLPANFCPPLCVGRQDDAPPSPAGQSAASGGSLSEASAPLRIATLRAELKALKGEVERKEAEAEKLEAGLQAKPSIAAPPPPAPLPHSTDGRTRELDSLQAAGLLLPAERAELIGQAAAVGVQPRAERSPAWLRLGLSASSYTVADRAGLLRRYLELVYRQPVRSHDDAAMADTVRSLGWLWNIAPVFLSCVHRTSSWPLHEVCGERTLSAGRPLSRLLSPIWEVGYMTSPRQCCRNLSTPASSPRSSRSHSMEPFTGPMVGADGFHGDNTWVEVMRIGSNHLVRGRTTIKRSARVLGLEGGANGAWFLVTSGTGVFINTGTSLRAPTRRHLAAALGINASAYGVAFGKINASEGNSMLSSLEDRMHLCPFARARGYTTIQVGAPEMLRKDSITSPCTQRRANQFPFELVCCYGGCIEPLPEASGCVGGGVLRTGLNGSLPCNCLDSSRVVNCFGTAKAELPWPSTREVPLFRPKGVVTGHWPYCSPKHWQQQGAGVRDGITGELLTR